MNSKQFMKSHWNYYLQLEKHVLDTQKYVDFNIKNYSTYSIEYLQLFLAICSEIDVMAKVIAKHQDPKFNGQSINKWGILVQEFIPDIQESSVYFNDEHACVPWEKWKHIRVCNKKGQIINKLAGDSKNPSWWTDYNKVKHERTQFDKNGNTHYSKANLGNVVYSLAALRVLEKSYLEYLIAEEKGTVDYNQGFLFKE